MRIKVLTLVLSDMLNNMKNNDGVERTPKSKGSAEVEAVGNARRVIDVGDYELDRRTSDR